MMGRSVSNGLDAGFLFHMTPPPFSCGSNYSNILIPSECTRVSGRHAGSTATARVSIVRKIIYLTKSEILYRECNRGRFGGDTTARTVRGDPIPLQYPHTL
jgi:hypothetical protein